MPRTCQKDTAAGCICGAHLDSVWAGQLETQVGALHREIYTWSVPCPASQAPGVVSEVDGKTPKFCEMPVGGFS